MLCLMPQRGDFRLHRSPAEIVERRAQSFPGNGGNRFFKTRQDRQTFGLPRNTETDARRNGLRDRRMQEGGQRLVERNAMACRNRTDSHRKRQVSRQPIENRIGPGGSGSDKGLSERQRLVEALRRSSHGKAEFRDAPQGSRILEYPPG